MHVIFNFVVTCHFVHWISSVSVFIFAFGHTSSEAEKTYGKLWIRSNLRENQSKLGDIGLM